MDFEVGIELISNAYRKKSDEDLYLRWLIGYEKTMGFEEFKNKLTANTVKPDNRTEEEILSNVKEILDMEI